MPTEQDIIDAAEGAGIAPDMVSAAEDGGVTTITGLSQGRPISVQIASTISAIDPDAAADALVAAFIENGCPTGAAAIAAEANFAARMADLDALEAENAAWTPTA